MNRDDRVILLLRTGGDAVPNPSFDGVAVLDASRRALRRRRGRQLVGGTAGTLALAVGLALGGPVTIPGLGVVAVPGSEELRGFFAIDASLSADGGRDRGDAVERRSEPSCSAPTRRTDSEHSAAVELPLVTGDYSDHVVLHTDDAQPLASCRAVRVHQRLTGDVPTDASSLTADGAFAQARPADGSWDGADGEVTDDVQVSRWLDWGPGWEVLADAERLDGRRTQAIGVAVRGDSAAWFEVPGTQVGSWPWRLRLFDGRATRVVSESSAEMGNQAGEVAFTGRRIVWSHASSTNVSSFWRLSAAQLDGTGPSESFGLVTAFATDDDEVVAALPQERFTNTHRGTDRTTTFAFHPDSFDEGGQLSISHPDTAVVSDLAVTDAVLAWVVRSTEGGARAEVYAMSRTGGGLSVVQLGSGVQDGSLRAGDDGVAWVDGQGGAAYFLHSVTKAEPVLVKVAASDWTTIGLAGDRIAWTTMDGDATTLTTGRTSW